MFLIKMHQYFSNWHKNNERTSWTTNGILNAIKQKNTFFTKILIKSHFYYKKYKFYRDKLNDFN